MFGLAFLRPTKSYSSPWPLQASARAHTNTKPEPVVQTGYTEYVSTAAFSPEGRWLASGARDIAVKIYEALKERGVTYCIRIPANESLKCKIAVANEPVYCCGQNANGNPG